MSEKQEAVIAIVALIDRLSGLPEGVSHNIRKEVEYIVDQIIQAAVESAKAQMDPGREDYDY